MAEITPFHRFVDPGLNYLFTNNFDLSIRILPDGFVFTVFDTLKTKFICLEEYRYPDTAILRSVYGSKEFCIWLEYVFVQSYLLQEHYNKVSILTGGFKFTLMPGPLFDPTNARKYLGFNHAIQDEDAVYYDMIKAPEACLVFSVPSGLNEWIRNHYPGSRQLHSCGSLIRSFYLQCKGSSPATRILANVQGDTIDIIIFKGSDFQFCNSFHYTSQTDLLYYLLFVMEQLKINTEESPLYLSGIVENESELYRLLATYFRFVGFIPDAEDRKFSPSFDHAPLPRYFDLLNVSLCG
ncbi:MAG: DUF3822 family protein [Bacteroidales bacterium]|nr:DUF3822 family protein [Bacteroidales bacterium]